VPAATTAELLLARAGDDATGLLFEDRRWSWGEVVAEAAVRAAVLEELRPAEGPWHVGVAADNEPEYLFLVAGAALAGATIVGVNTTRRGAELAGDILATDCAAVLVGAAQRPLFDDVDLGRTRLVELDGREYAGLLARHAAAPAIAREAALDPATRYLLLFTSGSTGAPKAVVCTTGRFAVICQYTPLQLRRDDVAYNAMPMFHGNALMASWGPCLVPGAAWALRRRFSASGFLPDVQRFGATYFNYVGRSLSYVLAQPERPEEHDNRLRFCFGTEASTRDQAEFERRYGCEVVESYGSSEGVCSIRRTPGTPPGALGLPPEGQRVEVRSADGAECPPARFDAAGRLVNADQAIGEIVAVGAASGFEGYWNNPAAEAEKVRGGDVWSGDLAYRDEHGWFWFAGRSSDWLRVNSENFAAAPVERILSRFPGVAVVAVYPVPDPRTGDLVMATLQLDDAASFDPAAFAAFLGAQPDLGTVWAPAYVRVTRDLPVTATRKVDKPALRRDSWEGPDPVWERTPTGYAELTAARRAELREELAAHGRITLLGT
jgi:steroid-22-oyl-CoA synthetase